jgi:hypothetical protein
MRTRIAGLLATLCALSVTLSAQPDPLAWFPLQPGSRWVYEHEWKSGDRNHPEVDRWTTEETITGTITIPDGLVTLRAVKSLSEPARRSVTVRMANGQVREQASEAHGGYLGTRDEAPYLVRGSCVYVVAGGGWDGQNRQLRPEYRLDLLEGSISPDFCFPLKADQKWGNNDLPWRVEPASAGAASFLAAEYAGAIHIFSSHFGSGGRDDVWFQKGVGVVGAHYIHLGTYDEYTKKLVSFSR